MAKVRCGWCGVVARIEIMAVGTSAVRDEGTGLPSFPTTAAYRCDNCSKLQLAFTTFIVSPGETPAGVSSTFTRMITDAPELVRWLPRSGEARDFADVPDHIASAASEAHECFSIQAFRAAVSLSRSVVEATAKEKGITARTLFEKIECMVAEGYLRPGAGAMAHEIRHWGNDTAHGDFIAPISASDAEGVLALMGEILQEVFQGPALLERIRALRQGVASGQP